MPAPKMKAISAAAENSTLAKMRMSIIARGVCSSQKMKATVASPPATSRKTMVSDAQPSRWPSAMPVISPSSAAQSRMKPSQSKRGICLGRGRVGMNSRPSAAASAQNGSEM